MVKGKAEVWHLRPSLVLTFVKLQCLEQFYISCAIEPVIKENFFTKNLLRENNPRWTKILHITLLDQTWRNWLRGNLGRKGKTLIKILKTYSTGPWISNKIVWNGVNTTILSFAWGKKGKTCIIGEDSWQRVRGWQ